MSADVRANLFPFPVEEPPVVNVRRGYFLSIVGTLLIVCGFFGAGLVANAVLWLVVELALLNSDQSGLPIPAHAWVVIVCILAIPLGAAMSVFGFSEGIRHRERGRRLRATDGREVLHRTDQRPVLFLRSFTDEELPYPLPGDFLQRRYEESLARVLAHLGPVIAIGRPGDPLGFAGAGRIYVSDTYWKEAIQYLMRRSTAVVIVVAQTGGLWWEIDTALKVLPHDRLLFCFPYVPETLRSRSRVALFIAFIKSWNLTRKAFRHMENERNERYQDFLRRTAGTPTKYLPANLGNSCFIDFAPDGRPRPLESCPYPLWRSNPLSILLNPELFMVLNPLARVVAPRHWRRVSFDIDLTLKPFLSKPHPKTY